MESYAPQIWPLRYLRGFFVPLCAEMSRFLDHLRRKRLENAEMSQKMDHLVLS